MSNIEGPVGGVQDASQTDVQQLFNQDMVTNNYDSSYMNNMNNVIIPTGSDQAQDVNVATFRDENTSLNG